MSAIPDPDHVAELEQRIKFLEQGLEQAVRIRQLWSSAVKDLKAARKELQRTVADLAGANEELVAKGEALAVVNEQLHTEIETRERVEAELRLSQKLESIGQLAAGVAHEINTPVQYIGDNTLFVQAAFASFQTLLNHLVLAVDAATSPETANLVDSIKRVLAESEFPGLIEEVPDALVETLEGVNQVAEIVRSMKEFSHQGSQEKSPVDINRALQTTVTVARSEWKYVAEVDLDLEGGLPSVYARGAELNQVFLNLLINAAHAVEDVVGDSGTDKGTITFSTRVDGDHVVVSLADSGAGIPDEIRDKIFDPFFTTKDVGKGSGQGLAIARSIVVEHHGGTLSVESRLGSGAKFVIRLPIKPPTEDSPADGVDEFAA